MNLPDILSAMLRRRKFLLVNSGVLTVLAVVVSLLLPYRYAATARILPPPEDDPMGLAAQLSVGLTSQLGRLRAGMFGGGTGSDGSGCWRGPANGPSTVAFARDGGIVCSRSVGLRPSVLCYGVL